MATKRELTSTFEMYFQNRIIKENAITPGQKKNLIEKLRKELKEKGRIPLPSGPVLVDPKHPVVSAALSGRSVAMSGKIIKKEDNQDLSQRMQNLPVPAKIAVMISMVLIPAILAMVVYYFLSAPTAKVAVISPTQTLTPTQTPTPNPSPTASPTATITPEIIPVVVPTIANTPTPTDFIVNDEDIASRNNEPASLEIAGLSYILGTGKIKQGVWEPKAAEWLDGSDLRRIIAIPYDVQTVDTLSRIPPGNVAKIRLRSGEIVKYKIAETFRVQRQQIEILAEKKPSLIIILSGEESIERTVITANAIQEPQDFTVYSISSRDPNPIVIVPTTQPSSGPTPVIITNLIITNTTTTITNTQVITP